jgi:hypothetical protein
MEVPGDNQTSAVFYAKSRSYPYYRLAYRAAGKRIVRSFSTYSEARKEAEAKVPELAISTKTWGSNPVWEWLRPLKRRDESKESGGASALHMAFTPIIRVHCLWKTSVPPLNRACAPQISLAPSTLDGFDRAHRFRTNQQLRVTFPTRPGGPQHRDDIGRLFRMNLAVHRFEGEIRNGGGATTTTS